MAQQSAAMMQQHEASMQRQAVSLEQQQAVMQQMEAARIAAEDAHRQHMEALRQLEENRAAAPVVGPEPRPAVREWSLEDFLKHHPTKFDGKTSPDAADQWLKDLERIYDAKMCPVENRLAFSAYMLTGEAEHWWSSTRSILEERDEPMSWEIFRERFLSEYFPDSIRYAKEVEFLQLTQGGKTVTEYAERFKHLSRFYTLPLDEEWRCRKFENGLRGDIRLMVAPLSIKDFGALVEKARVMEKMKREVEGQRPSSHSHPRGSVDHLGPGPDMRSGGDHMIDHTISLRSLGAFLLSRAEFDVSRVGDPTRGTLVHVGMVTVGVITVARKATLGGIVPTLLGQRPALQFRHPISIRGETEATSLRRWAESMP